MSRSRSRSPIIDLTTDAKDEIDNDRYRGRKNFSKRIDRRIGTKDIPFDQRVYVSNIPFEFKWQDLKDLFRLEVGEVSYVELFMDDNGQPRGSAIVDFDCSSAAEKAVSTMHRKPVKGRKLVVKNRSEAMNSRDFMFLFDKERGSGRSHMNFRNGGNDGGGSYRGSRMGGGFSEPPKSVNYGNTYGLSIQFLESLGINAPIINKIFVANLDFKVNEDDLKDVFKVAGKVMDVEMLKDQSGASRGFAVIEYEHPVQAVQAISMLHNQVYRERKLHVRMDRGSDKQKTTSNAKLPSGLKGLGMGLGNNGEAILDLTVMQQMQQSTGSSLGPVNSGAPMGGGGCSNIGMGNMQSNMGGAGMSTNIGGNIGGGGMAPAPNMGNNMGGCGGGMGMGSFSGGNSSLDNNMGVGMNNMMTNSYGVNPPMPMSTGTNMPVVGNPISSLGNMSNMGSNNGMPSNRIVIEYNDGNSGGGGRGVINTERGNVVQISNLPLEYTWKNLKDFCRAYGDIRFAEIHSPGVGMVRFGSADEARRARDMMDKQKFNGCYLEACVL